MRWMRKNILRKSAALGVPFNPPAFHPLNPLVALRVSSLSLLPAERSRLIDALFRAVWVRGLHVSEPDVVRSIADDAGLPGAERFWGYDDWPQLARFLEGADPLDPGEWKKWTTPLRASAMRPR